MNPRIASYIEQFRQIFDGDPWLDESFFKKLDNLSEREVFVQPPEQNHCVAEIVSHVTEWRKEIIRRLALNSSLRLLTEESLNNWRQLRQLQQTGWQELYSDLKQSQKHLINLLDARDDGFLDEPLGDAEFNKEYFVAGILHHDLYHLGQIGLILKMTKKS